ncbi:MAG: alpha/beta fold hydrolase [Chloroflexi bacterium]|nr:alpha/beta fold hydrolase [Chloroflexota bacterium]
MHVQHFHPRGRRGTVLFLHGLGSAGEAWAGQAPVLRALDLQGLAPDLPGFGRSPWPGGPVTLDRFADFAREVLDQHGVERAHVVGISFGGVVAQRLALRAPERVQTLTLVNTFARLKPQTWRDWLYFLTRGALALLLSPRWQASLVAKRIFPKPEHQTFRQILAQHIRMADPRVYRRVMWELMRVDLTDELPRIQAPTLVVMGQEDTTTPPQVQQILAERIPNARAVLLPGGHGLIADQADAFNQTWQAFLQEHLEKAG